MVNLRTHVVTIHFSLFFGIPCSFKPHILNQAQKIQALIKLGCLENMKSIIPRDPRGSTGSIWRKYPLKQVHFSQNGASGEFTITRKVRSIASIR